MSKRDRDLLAAAVASGQVSSSQIVQHVKAGEYRPAEKRS